MSGSREKPVPLRDEIKVARRGTDGASRWESARRATRRRPVASGAAGRGGAERRASNGTPLLVALPVAGPQLKWSAVVRLPVLHIDAFGDARNDKITRRVEPELLIGTTRTRRELDARSVGRRAARDVHAQAQGP